MSATKPDNAADAAPARTPAWGDQQAEQVIGNLLRIGVATAAVIVFVGGVRYLLQFGGQIPKHTLFTGEPADLRSAQGIVADAFQGNSRGIIGVGVLALLATPIARVAFSILAFARERDRLYVGITLFVLAVLLFSLIR